MARPISAAPCSAPAMSSPASGARKPSSGSLTAGSRRASNVSERLSVRRACRLSSAAISWARCWDKLLVNVATGALSGITRLAYGGLYAVPELEVIATAAVAEAIAVAKASGIELETVHPHEAWVKAASGLPPEFKASMLQSLEKGSVTEVDFINGAVVRAGAKAGVPTPV